MITNEVRRLSTFGLLIAVMLSTSCSRAPSFDIVGSFFPAWLVCLALGLLLTVTAYWLLLRVRVVLALPILTYPSLTALFTLALWLAFFR
jgi:YtcA family